MCVYFLLKVYSRFCSKNVRHFETSYFVFLLNLLMYLWYDGLVLVLSYGTHTTKLSLSLSLVISTVKIITVTLSLSRKRMIHFLERILPGIDYLTKTNIYSVAWVGVSMLRCYSTVLKLFTTFPALSDYGDAHFQPSCWPCISLISLPE